jgi:tRNA threonylcarbamoyladenosine biosynthesis protein TsaE
MKLQNKVIILNNEQDSILLAESIAKNLQPSEIITFSGDLGCGKTFICREIIKYFCGEDTEVTSPTFNLVQIYKAQKCLIYHFDLYRLKYLEEIYELAIEDALQDNICLIEWPAIIEPILPRPLMKISLQIIDNDQRSCKIDYQ